MFYFKEVFFNIFYGVLAFMVLFFVVFFFQETIVCGFISSIIDHSNINIPSFPEYSFIFESLEKLILFKFGFSFSLSLLLIVPFYIKQFYYFYITCLADIYAKQVYNFKNKIYLVFFMVNFILLFKVLPFLWILIDSTASYLSESSLINIELNCGIELFIYFLFYSLIVFNINFFIHFLIFSYMYFFKNNNKVLYSILFIKNLLFYTFFVYIFFIGVFETHIIFIYFINIILSHCFDFLYIVIILYKYLSYNIKITD